MRRRSRHEADQAEINITPMLDIVFIMLIFFIVTTSFVKEVAIDVSRPSNQPQKTERLSEVIAIHILDTGEIMLQQRIIDIRAVRASIETALAAKPNANIVVIANRKADAGLLVRVIDQARIAGADKVSLAAEAI
ncbi:MAG: biopolymer transporter ExbD [Gammaproteobacteria bacterium]|nr:biopolymer transporter ExbD [Gammaproteobacteria bacterium]MDH3767706.1 biopolymer transporter ExbD [Gammaproteobacteria bacterium]